MNIEITKEEYARLLDLLSIAGSVLKDRRTGEDGRTVRYDRVIQKFYALAEEMGQAGRIVYDRDLGKYLPAGESEESSEARQLLDEFADDTFWHELIFRFTERDLERRAGGHEKLHRLAPEERFDLETPIEEKYLEEFEEHGIDRLEIVERFDVGGKKPKTSD